MADLILFGLQVLTSTQNTLVNRLLGLELCLQHLQEYEFPSINPPYVKLLKIVFHLVLLLGQLNVAEVSSKAGALQPQPALIQPGLKLLAVIEELKQPQLSLQLPPPERRGGRGKERESDREKRRERGKSRCHILK